MRNRVGLFVVMLLVWSKGLQAAEGMWDFTNLPVATIKQDFGFDLPQNCAEHLLASSVRFPNGSASFVSENGLVITNHHVALGSISKLATAEHDYVKNGFRAADASQELPVPGLELLRLLNIRDVTDEVNSVVTAGMSTESASLARKAKMAEIEKAGKGDKLDLQCDTVTLYNGGKYHLYTYKVYRDVRLTFAPEMQAAFFGGDPDNFEFPRWALDFSLFRVYEDGKPAKIENYLKVNPNGVKEGDLTFASGHPGSTGRLLTVAALEFNRDLSVPFQMDLLRRQEIALQQYSYRSVEAGRQAKNTLFSVQNSRKVFIGREQGLRSSEFFASKYREETDLRIYASTTPGLEAAAGAWDKIAKARAAYRQYFKETNLLESGMAFNSQLFKIARDIVRMADEDLKPNADRLEEYRESARQSLLFKLYAKTPIYPELEIVLLTESLTVLTNSIGPEHQSRPLVDNILQGKTPEVRARELVVGSGLIDVEARKLLVAQGKAGVESSYDSLIQLARLVDPISRELRKRFENEVQEVERQAYSQIADVLFKKFGTSRYPDATFTLRLTYGQVEGYPDYGTQIPAFTDISGLYRRSEERGNREPWDLPQSWIDSKPALNQGTPFNFAVRLDTIGGNSGSPIVDKDMKLIGLVFDGNRHSPMTHYAYNDKQRRTLAVDIRVVLESLRGVYGMGYLADEMVP